ncbi:MAG: OmpH family outer membrane protein [Acidobacteria bacterium]|nr:MAG: OmpH family outer membrane protein [Acidobacteriota bacterium]REK00155.1 MAG: OmpH family outer membrane protein [Acidobacteriota bacterium]
MSIALRNLSPSNPPAAGSDGVVPRLRKLTAALLAVAVAAVGTLTAAAAQEPSAQSAPRTAVLDLEVAFLASSFGKSLKGTLDELQKSTDAQLDEKAKQAEALEAEAAGKSQAELVALQRRMEDLEIEARRIRETAQRSASRAEAEQRELFGKRLEEILTAIQEERSYDLILNKSAGAVIFAGQSIDITREIVERLGTE